MAKRMTLRMIDIQVREKPLSDETRDVSPSLLHWILDIAQWNNYSSTRAIIRPFWHQNFKGQEGQLAMRQESPQKQYFTCIHTAG